MKKYMKLSTYAKNMGISYQTARNYFKAGKLKGYQDKDTLTIYIESENIEEQQIPKNKAIIYSRVSSPQNKDSLDGQIERCKLFCNARGWIVVDEIKEIASGLNEDRRMLWKILKREDFDFLIVEHKDRLARFGVRFIEEILNKKDKKLIIINETIEKDKKEELMEDFVAIVISFCNRLYSKNRKQRTEQIIESIKREDLS